MCVYSLHGVRVVRSTVNRVVMSPVDVNSVLQFSKSCRSQTLRFMQRCSLSLYIFTGLIYRLQLTGR